MTDLNEREMRSYWDAKITSWASSSYEEAPRGPVQKFMANLRRSVHARAVIAIEVLKPHLAGKTVLDLGCGNGHFAAGCLEAGAARVIGMDIAPQAVELAKELAKRNNIADRTEFYVGNVTDGSFPEADFTTGFGLVDWLEPEECRAMLDALRGRKVLFSYSEADGTFDEWVHYFYLVKRLEWFGGGVRAYHHKREEILSRFRDGGFGEMQVVVRKEMRFGRLVHNLG
jgi:predicted RNA methylase